MKGARSFSMVALAMLLLGSLVAIPAVGDENNPEITDATGDSTTSRADQDIESAWVQEETNVTLWFQIKLRELSVFSPRADWQTLPQIWYDYYFTIRGKDYALRASIPVHGPLAVFAGFNLYQVEYGATGDNMTFNALTGNVSGLYNAANAYVELQVDKADVNRPDRGDLVTHMWAAVWYQPRGQAATRVDSAMSYSSPGRNYLIKGQFEHYYDVDLSAQNITVTGAPRTTPARFNLTIRNNSDIDIYINLTNTTPLNDKVVALDYHVNYSRRDVNGINVGVNASVTVVISVFIPDNATNTTDVTFSVWGVYQTTDNTELETNRLNLMVQVRYIPPKPPVKRDTIIDIFKDNAAMFGSIIIVVIVLVVVYILFERHKQREEEEDLLAFQAYVEAHKAQRESTDTTTGTGTGRGMPP